MADGFVTNESLRYMLNIHKASIAELLKNMCNSGLLVAEGYGRGTKYKLPNMATSDANVATSDANVATSDANVATSDANVATPDVNNRIKMRMKSEELERLIKNTCQDWISLDELASAICRSPKYLRSRIIPNLIENNTLEMMFPTIPNHPKQKYKLKEK